MRRVQGEKTRASFTHNVMSTIAKISWEKEMRVVGVMVPLTPMTVNLKSDPQNSRPFTCVAFCHHVR